MSDLAPDTCVTFGDLLKHLRRRARLTQQEFGAAVGYSHAHVARLESGERLPDLTAVKALFIPALDLADAPALAQRLLDLAVTVHNTPPPEPTKPASPTPYSNNLPIPLTPFIGRAQAVAEVQQLLRRNRLVTLTGAGGVGKTRLALQVGAATRAAPTAPATAAPAFPNGVRLVELAPLNDPALVPLAAARAFRLPEATEEEPTVALAAFLAHRCVLLVLDNCEHLIDACAALADALLRACPELTILATSREPLRVPGELAWRVPSMETSEATRLFEQHAQLAQPGFALAENNTATVNDICQRLDGIPLAIELAAAQVRVLPVEQIAARLDDRLRLLTGGWRTALPRQQTLRATIDWSYALLSDAERALFARLAVFVGGWTLEAAEAVCGDQPLVMEALAGELHPAIPSNDVLGLLTGLVDKSLVVAENHGGTMRYRLLETLRQYAQERLDETSQTCALRDRHLAWYLDFTERTNAVLLLSKFQPWKARMQSEYDNLHADLAWCRANETESAHAEAWLRMAVALMHFWSLTKFGREVMQWLQWLWDSAAWRRVTQPAAGDSPTLQTKVLYMLWLLPIELRIGSSPGKLAELAGPAKACLERCRADGDLLGVGYALLVQSWLALFNQDAARAKPLALEGMRVFEELHDLLGLQAVFYLFLPLYLRLHAHAELVALVEQHIQHVQTWETGWYYGCLIQCLAEQMQYLGEHERAVALGEQLLAITEQWEDPVGSWQAMSLLAVANPARALTLAEQWLAQQRQVGNEDIITLALHQLGVILLDNTKYERAYAVLDECVTLLRVMSDVPSWVGLAQALYYRSIAARFLGNYRQALAGFDECERVRTEWSSGEEWLGVAVLYQRGLTLLDMGEVAAATAAFKVSLREFQKVHASRDTVPQLFTALAEVMWTHEQPQPAMRLAGAAAAFAVWERRSNRHEVNRYERTIAVARAQLGDAALAAAWAEGQAMTWDQAIEYALVGLPSI